MRCSAITSFLSMLVFVLGIVLAVGLKLRILANSTPPVAASAPLQADASVRVWAQQNSGLYYCPRMKLYGEGRDGVYLSETDALDDGYRPALGAGCLQARR